MRQLPVGLAVVVALGVSGCAGGASSPAAPTQSSELTLTVSSTAGYVYLGSTQQMTVAASDGHALTGGTWGSDTPSVATVDTMGLASGIGAGQSNIYFISGGHQGTKLLRGMPRVAGTFQGTYTVSSCTQNGDLGALDVCSVFSIGAVAPYTFILSQTADLVTGNFALGSFNFGNFSSIIAVPGSFGFTGRAIGTDPLVIVATWSLSQKIPNTLGGTVQIVLSNPPSSGSATVMGSISTLTKISSLEGAVRSATPRTLDEVVRAMLTR